MSNIQQKLADSRKSQEKRAIGQVNWFLNTSRPEISYQVSSISSVINEAATNNIKEVNKIIRWS